MGRWLEEAWREARVAVRRWGTSPEVAVAAVLTLALGIGFSTTIVGAVYAIVLRPLPFGESERFVYVAGGDVPASPGVMTLALPMSDIPRLQAESETLAGISPLVVDDVLTDLRGSSGPVRMRRARVSPAAFSVFNVHPQRGRVFGDHDADLGAQPVMMLSSATWRTHFGSDPGIVGREIVAGGVGYIVIGIMPQGFAFPSADVQLWAVTSMAVDQIEKSPVGGTITERAVSGRATPSGEVSASPTSAMAVTIARVREGESLATATAEVNALFLGMHSGDARARSAGAPPPLRLVPLKEQMIAPVRPALFMLLAAAALLWSMCCSNVALLLLVRAMRRRQEIGIRVALGASAGRVMAEVLADGLVVAMCGGLVGVLLAWLGLLGLNAFLGSTFPRLAEAKVDGSFILIGMASSFLTGLVPSVVCGVQIVRSRFICIVRDGMSHGGAVRRVTGLGLVPNVVMLIQVTSAVALTTISGLLIQTVANLRGRDLGYDPSNVLLVEVRIPASGEAYGGRAGVYGRLLERLSAIPGTASVAATSRLPIQPGGGLLGVLQVPGSAERIPVNLVAVSAGYFDAIRLRLVAGRWFDVRDEVNGQVSIVVSKNVALRCPDGQAIGRVVGLSGPLENMPLHVVGVVDDTTAGGLDGVVKPDVYFGIQRWPAEPRYQAMIGNMAFVIRGSGDLMWLAPTVRSLVGQIEPTAIVDSISSLQLRVSSSVERPRTYAALLGVLALVAVTIALVGIYGLITYVVKVRTHEIGIRVALGARRAQIAKAVLGRCLGVVLIGIGAGLSCAAAMTQYLRALLFGLTALDGVTYCVVAVTFATVAGLAASVPTRRALKVEALVALRAD